MRKDCGTCHFEKNLLEEEPCNRCDDNNSEWKSGKIYFAIAELEKIKTDILNLGFTGWADKPKLDREEVLTILNKYISALSGDNKQSRCNSCRNNTGELSGECYECVKGIEDWYEPISELKGENNE